LSASAPGFLLAGLFDMKQCDPRWSAYTWSEPACASSHNRDPPCAGEGQGDAHPYHERRE